MLTLPTSPRLRPETGAAEVALDHVLELVERGDLSATELRVLLQLIEHRDASLGELADALGALPSEIARAGRRLAMRGLVRARHAGRTEQTVLEIAAAGIAVMEALLAATSRPGPDGH